MELAQARYAMGVDKVGSLQYAPEMEATVRVEKGLSRRALLYLNPDK